MSQTNHTDSPHSADSAGSGAATVQPDVATAAAAGDNVVPISELRDLARPALDPLLESRARIAPISQLYDASGLQEPADPRHVFELRKNGTQYALHATDPSATFVPSVDGGFIFVVKADDPGRVYVALERALAPPALRQYGVQGHTSFDGGGDVLYAGEVAFDNGRLVGWNNSSGHYRPSREARHVNMLPVVRALLPEAAFGATHRPMTLKLGNIDIPLEDLRAMGARVGRRRLWAAVLEDGVAAVQSDIENRLQFDAEYLTGAHRAPRAARNAEILLQVMAVRSATTPLVIDSTGNALIGKLNDQLGRLKLTLGRAAQGVKSNIVTHLMPGGGVVRQTGVGLQLFGLYNSVRGLSAAIERGDTVDMLIQASGLAAQPGSLAAEVAIPALGRYLQAGNVARFNAFAASTLGQRLGGTAHLGSNIARTGAVGGAGISVPFDLYNAVTSFQQGARSDGLVAQDHYVNGGLATAGAVSSIGLAAAAFAGVGAAGPIGLAVGLGLALVGGIYHSVRYVDDLDRHAGLSAGERFVTGLSSFVGGGASQDIEDRAAVGRAREVYVQAKQGQLRAVLTQNQWRDAIFGDAVITPQAPLVEASTSIFRDPTEPSTMLVQRPAQVIDNAADDNINASAGLHGVANRVRRSSSRTAGGARAGSDAVLWATGDGNDRLLGVIDHPNVFSLRTGMKAVRGGRQEDIFVLSAPPVGDSAFDGGEGADTLALAAGAASPVRVRLDWHDENWTWDSSADTYIEEYGEGNRQQRNKSGARVAITPDAGRLRWNGTSSALRSIENIVTSAAATTEISGNCRDNVFVLNGQGDSAFGAGGDDTYIVNGGGHVALETGVGDNSFRIGRGVEEVDIWSQSRQDRMVLEFDLAEIEVRAVGNDLSLALRDGQAQGTVKFHGMFAAPEVGARQARRNDGSLRLWTRDGFLVAPMLSSVGRSEDGLIELAATPATGPDANAMDLLIQYASTLGAASAAGTTDSTTPLSATVRTTLAGNALAGATVA